MKNVHIAFNFIEDYAHIPIGFQQIRCQLVFDIKMNFTYKVHLVEGGIQPKYQRCQTTLALSRANLFVLKSLKQL